MSGVGSEDAGVSFGTWIAMQLLMRRPEIAGFICGDKDRVVPSNSVAELVAKTKIPSSLVPTTSSRTRSRS
jgi:alpha/beta superfamily hydrolase